MHIPLEYRCLIKILGSPTLLGVHFGMAEGACMDADTVAIPKFQNNLLLSNRVLSGRCGDGPGHQLICIGAKGRDITCPN